MFDKIGALQFLILVIFVFPLYFLPLIIAAARHHPHILGIFLIDLFLGWTFLGWVGALVWSVWTIEQPLKSEPGIKKSSNALAIASVLQKARSQVKNSTA